MLTISEELKLVGFAQDRARDFRRAAELLRQAAGELLVRRYRPALDYIIEAEQHIGHDIVTQPERETLREIAAAKSTVESCCV